MGTISTTNRLTILLVPAPGSLRPAHYPSRTAAPAEVPKDLVYRLDSGEARYLDLDALARLCRVLDCAPAEILVWVKQETSAP